MQFSNKFELDGIKFEEPVPNLFSFNNPYGACPTCGGFSLVLGIDPDLVIPDKRLSVYENAVAPWRGEKLGLWKEALIRSCKDVLIFLFISQSLILRLHNIIYYGQAMNILRALMIFLKR
ncbi:MAG: hypothetical protein WKF59_25070 [Chitinophagaceae bacterium]